MTNSLIATALCAATLIVIVVMLCKMVKAAFKSGLILLILLFSCLSMYMGQSIYSAKHAPAPTAEQICAQCGVSYTLCRTIAEYTGDNEIDVAYFLEFAAKNNMDPKDAVGMIDPSLSETESIAILAWSNNREEQAQEEVTE